MKLLVFILNRIDTLESLLIRLAEEGIRGATILSSTGMARALSDFGNENFTFFTSLRTLFNSENAENKTILTVVSEEQVQIVLNVIDEVVGDLSKPNTGIVFTIPIDTVKGLCKTE